MSTQERPVRVVMASDGTVDVDALCERLAVAERALMVQSHMKPPGQRPDACDVDKAALQAWLEWWNTYGSMAAPVDPGEVMILAARRDVVRNVTLIRLRRDGGSR